MKKFKNKKLSHSSKLWLTRQNKDPLVNRAKIQNYRSRAVFKLIEINSEMFGWGPAGSSLFSWIYNPPPQHDEPPKFMIVGRF